ncbi:GNAT family N-acetyltransferase [Wenjunlia tyrosinilytica]|uniref:GNAT family N-acetyltransferase n=1 Tax=Wenjunlia tyrosinilytica TaxID=1544741 RepID=UPI0027E41C08|nr:GNAT family N-acetyltransferase [Wenjunlia tyrosinilytica]
MTWTTTEELDEFQAHAGDFLRARPAENTVLLTVAESLRVRGTTAFGGTGPRFGWWRGNGGDVEGALLQTPPYPVLLTRLPREAVEPLVEALAADGCADVPGVDGANDVVDAFAAAWRRHTGAGHRVHQRHRQYRLAAPARPRPVPAGRARVATPKDRDLLIRWYEAFGRETGTLAGTPAGAVDDRVGHGGLTLWEVDSRPVALAGTTRMVAGTVRVGPVYTPAEERRRGYAGAATAEVGRAALAAGAREVVLFADLANPTSNALYQRLGYRPLGDRAVLHFPPPTASDSDMEHPMARDAASAGGDPGGTAPSSGALRAAGHRGPPRSAPAAGHPSRRTPPRRG